MSNLNVIVAQGGAYYGCAVMTSELTLDQIKNKLQAAGMKVADGKGVGDGHDECQLYVGFDTEPNGDSGYAIIRPWAGQPQPEPTLVFCSGHSKQDMAHLQLIKAALES